MGYRRQHFLFCSHAKIHHSESLPLTIPSIQQSSLLSFSLTLNVSSFLLPLIFFSFSFYIYHSLQDLHLSHLWLQLWLYCHSCCPFFLFTSSLEMGISHLKRRCSMCKCCRGNSNLVAWVAYFQKQVSSYTLFFLGFLSNFTLDLLLFNQKYFPFYVIIKKISFFS